jgi:hypothetical protein
VITFAAVGALAAAGAQGQASAAQVEQSGWWTSVALTAPTAPAGSLLVQGGPDANTPIAYAGISFSLSEGESPSALKLTVNASGGNTPNATLQLCKAKGTIGGDAGGDSANGPKFDCSTKVQAAPSADGTSYEFKDGLSSLADAGSLAVVVLPTMATDRVALNKPDGSALQSSSGGSSLSDTSSDSSFSSDSSSVGSGSGGSFGSSPAGSFDVGPAPLPSVSADASRADAADTGSGAGGGSTGASAQTIASQQPGSKDHSLVPWLFAGLAAAAGALWALAGRVSDDPATVSTETD